MDELEDDESAMARAMAKFGAKAATVDDDDPPPPARKRKRDEPRARKKQAERLKTTVDGRSLRETGRTAQFNFKCKPEIRAAAQGLGDSQGVTIAEFMESLIERALEDAE